MVSTCAQNTKPSRQFIVAHVMKCKTKPLTFAMPGVPCRDRGFVQVSPVFAKTSGGVPHASVTELPDVSLRASRYSAGCTSGCLCDDVSLPDLCCGQQPRQHRYEEGHQPSSSGAAWLPTQTCARYTEDHKSPASDAACTAAMCAADG